LVNIHKKHAIGVLAVQGDFKRHGDVIERLGLQVNWIKNPADLNDCSALILPGGESTTMSLMLQKYGLTGSLRAFGKTHSVMGTCAGAILLASHTADSRVEPLKLMDISVERNAYGSQINSFITYLDIPFAENTTPLKAVFIRAPKIKAESSAVDILAWYDDAPVIARQGRHLALTFHPELTDDTRIHRYFLERVAGIYLET
jgi:pyridoxal 5'-phosphate synthase pdxT subunit